MTRLAATILLALTLYYGFPPAATIVGATFEHFAGQDGDQ